MQAFERYLIGAYGDKGQKWLADLPKRLDRIATQYRLRDLVPIPNIQLHYVAFGYRGDVPIVLKLALEEESLAREAACLHAFSGHGAILALT